MEPLILHIESSARVCSVALSRGSELLENRESHAGKTHSTVLTPFIEEVMRAARFHPGDLDAVAVSQGPGSYTGLRIGVSVAKGICYATSKPLIALSTLRILCSSFISSFPQLPAETILCPVVDARRMEVYTAFFNLQLENLSPVQAVIFDNEVLQSLPVGDSIAFFGDGAPKLSPYLTQPVHQVYEGHEPLAKAMIPLAIESFRQQKFEDTAYMEPFYLKDFVATIPRKLGNTLNR